MSVQAAPHLYRVGQECIAKYDFRGSNSDDLPFIKGEVLKIVKCTRDNNWYKAENMHGRQGMIPVNYVRSKEIDIMSMPWFHGKISRDKADQLLTSLDQNKDPRATGTFLVRESSKFPGDYTLCVYCDGQVERYHITRTPDKQFTLDSGESNFANLIKLVSHYTKHADGLVCRLKIACVRPLLNQHSVILSKDSGWLIQSSELEMGKIIGSGEFGDVLLCKFRGENVAVKSLKNNPHAANTFLQEASLMTTLLHPNLVQLLGIVYEDEIRIVTEYMSKGSLVEFLRTRGRSIVLPEQLLSFAVDISCGMYYLESREFVHRDLAARNVLISEQNIAKVADFGMAQKGDIAIDSGVFPIKWTAPEALQNNQFSTKSDVWSFGILMWELYSYGRVPYPKVFKEDVLMRIVDGYRMFPPDGCPENIYKIMATCWDIDPEGRPYFHDLHRQLSSSRGVSV